MDCHIEDIKNEEAVIYIVCEEQHSVFDFISALEPIAHLAAKM
jgi:hypothetical protein